MDAEGISFTEREYDYAVDTGKFVIAFVHGEPEAISVRNSDVKPEVVQALNAFREKVKTGRLVREWKDRQQLEAVVIKSLSIAFSNYPQVGWIRGNAAANDQVLQQSNRALQENAELRSKIAKLEAVEPPRYENMADLDDEFEIRYRTRYARSSRSDAYAYTDRTFALTWRQIFIPLAATLGTSKTASSISIAVKQAMSEANCGYTPYDIHDLDVATIQAQFVALGLIKAAVGKSVNGTFHEYLSLTDQGRGTYMDTMVVRKPHN